MKHPTKFIHNDGISMDRYKDVMWGQFVHTIWPENIMQNWIRFIVMGDHTNYPGEMATPTDDMLVSKMLSSSVISTKVAKL